MILLHQVHSLRSGAGPEFEELTRDRLLPLSASETARFAFYAVPTGAAIHQDEVITMIALKDGDALGRFSERVRTGDLANTGNQLAALRTDVATRLLKPLDYDPSQLRIEDIPASVRLKPAVSYMHDFVPPVIGQNHAYVDMMRERYMALTETELSGVVLRLSWETVWGGGPVPEMFNLSEIRSPSALLQLVGKEIPGEYKQIGSWMWDALGVRDRWTTRLLRSATWSPIV
jgi:hypothetical protein